MALPKWITPAGQLGIVPELEYYEFPLDAYDASGGTLVYSLVSGRLPRGLQIISTGKIQGVPVSENQSGDVNVEYKFTVRVKNAATNGIADRTFRLTITNVAPPIITPKNVYLGLVLDGTIINLQLEAIEFNTGAPLVWSLSKGELPSNLTLTENGLISGWIEPIENTGPLSEVGWGGHQDNGDPNIVDTEPTNPNWRVSDGVVTPWDSIGWDASLTAISKTFTFEVQVFDGVNYDASTYKLKVYPRSTLRCDNDELEVDTTVITTDIDNNKHYPIIITTQDDLFPVRQGSYFSFDVNAVDLDGDRLKYNVPSSSTGSFDEQTVTGETDPYVPRRLVDGFLNSGILPKATVVETDGNSLTSENSIDNTLMNFEPGDVLKVVGGDGLWYDASVNSLANITLTGVGKVAAPIGGTLTQDISGATATITANSATVGTIEALGSLFRGTLDISGSAIRSIKLNLTGAVTANVGNFITQAVTNANARVTANVINSTVVPVSMISANPFVTGTTDISVNGVDQFNLYPTTVTSTTLVLNRSTTITVGSILKQFDNYTAEVTATVTSATIPVKYLIPGFLTGNANVRINAVDSNQKVSSIDPISITANIGDYITQDGRTVNAIVTTSNVVDSPTAEIRYLTGSFSTSGTIGNIRINGVSVAAQPTTATTRILTPEYITASAGSYITQTGSTGNATVLESVTNGNFLRLEFNSGSFNTTGALIVNGSSTFLSPNTIVADTKITIDYSGANVIFFNSTNSTAVAKINSVSTSSYPTRVNSVGVDIDVLSDEGTFGFDEVKFDQGQLALPAGLTINEDTGWITGILPIQVNEEITYDFEIEAYKDNDPSYSSQKLYRLTVLGDLNNKIEWITPTYVGSIENGKISDLAVQAESTRGKTLFYYLTPGAVQRLPQGLQLTSSGLLSGRVSFELYSLDGGTTTIDNRTTTFDETYTFSVTARDIDQTVSSERLFTISVVGRNIRPYENLYLKAMPTLEQRRLFLDIVQNTNIFPNELIYRNEDPYFGVVKELKTLFLPGLAPSELSEYAQAVAINHFGKRITTTGEIKTAVARDDNFNVKYEVVYLEIQDSNTNAFGESPADTIDLSQIIDTPYYDDQGNSYTTATPNAFGNMSNAVANALGYANKGALPDWMTSRQADGRVLGFTRAVVLAYTVPNASELIAYRLSKLNFNFNQIDFTVDRYVLDNHLSTNYDIQAGAFISSNETTFDKYPTTLSIYQDQGTVDYAVRIPFEEINNCYVAAIRTQGGLDGVQTFKSGQRLVFAQQEFFLDQSDSSDVNQGWSDAISLWDGELWDDDKNTVTVSDDLGWDSTGYVPGFNEWTDNRVVTTDENGATVITYPVPNKRIGIWEITISDQNLVRLTFVQEMNYNDMVYVRNGVTYSGTNIYYNKTVPPGLTFPTYSVISEQVSTTYTTFDGNGTRFYDNRDIYSLPGEGDKYIKFAKLGVFN